ncbi:MAG: alpha/beta fold hydrolase [bacterium]|nr:alpha/beta fold hydrolase [bacterium]
MPIFCFIHGAGCTAEVFAEQLAAFPDALAPTLPGHTTPGAPASIAAFADALEADLAPRGEREIVLVGSSMGGAIALELALRRLPQVAGIVLIGSGARLRVAPAIFESIERDFPAAARMLAGYFFADATPERVERAAAAMLAVGAEQTLRDFHACNAFDATERLGEIAVPLLALVGERDVMMPPKFSQFVADRVPGAQARILPEAGHLAMLESPAATNEALRSFVTQL